MATKDTKFSGSHGSPKKPIDKKGLPSFQESTPGKDWKTGTPGYIRNAASAAERKREFNTDSHRQHVSNRAGAPEHRADPRLRIHDETDATE